MAAWVNCNQKTTSVILITYLLVQYYCQQLLSHNGTEIMVISPCKNHGMYEYIIRSVCRPSLLILTTCHFDNVAIQQYNSLRIILPVFVFSGIQFQPPLAADPNQGPWITPEFLTQQLAMHPPTLPVHKPTYQTYHPSQFTVPTLQPPYSSGGYREMHPEQLPPIPPIEPTLLPYRAQSILPHTTVLLSTQSEFHPVDSSTASYHITKFIVE